MDPTLLPFLTTDQFQELYRGTLTPKQRALVDLWVQAAADWIRDPSRLPGLRIDEPRAVQAKIVTFEVVRDALGPDGVTDPRVRSYLSTTDNRTTSITYADAAAMLEFDDHHLSLLGLSTSAAPRAQFDGFCEPGPRQW